MAAPNELAIRLRLDTGDAKRERDAFLGGFGGAALGTAAAGIGGAPFGFASRTASTALGTTLSTVMADVLEGPLAAARVAGRTISRESGARAFAERTRSFFSTEDEVKEALGLAARGMSLEDIRRFAAPLQAFRQAESEGRLRVEEALEGSGGGLAAQLSGGDPAIAALLQSGQDLATAFGELLALSQELIGVFGKVVNLFR